MLRTWRSLDHKTEVPIAAPCLSHSPTSSGLTRPEAEQMMQAERRFTSFHLGSKSCGENQTGLWQRPQGQPCGYSAQHAALPFAVSCARRFARQTRASEATWGSLPRSDGRSLISSNEVSRIPANQVWTCRTDRSSPQGVVLSMHSDSEVIYL